MTDEEIVESIIQIASSFGISCDDASYIVKSFENFGKEFMTVSYTHLTLPTT